MVNPFSLITWLVFAFFCGSLPFSVWIGRWSLGKDIRAYGDANPGATNVLRAGGRLAFALALLLDFLKGALPVGAAHFLAPMSGWLLALLALMPVLGHAISPFLGWRGGKAVAVTGGIWCGLTVWEGPTVGGLLLGLATWMIGANGWAVLIAVSGLLLYLLSTPSAWNQLDARPNAGVILAVGLGNLALLAWKQSADLRQRPRLRLWRSPSINT
jgi:glycerol-3-phosphate acyltransferase PlsY